MGAGVRYPPWADYYLSPHNHGAPRFASRRRVTEHASRGDGRSPSPTFKAIGADNVATGSMAGMRLLHRLKKALAGDLVVWPFDPVSAAEKGVALIIVEIFPSLYFHAAGLNPARNAAADPMFMSKALAAYDSLGVPKNFHPLGSDADEADAMISAAAMRHFAKIAGCGRYLPQPNRRPQRGMDFRCWVMAARKARSVTPSLAEPIHYQTSDLRSRSNNSRNSSF